MADGDRIFYLDSNEKLLDQRGVLTEEFSPDQIHFTSKAYEIWAKDLMEIIGK